MRSLRWVIGILIALSVLGLLLAELIDEFDLTTSHHFSSGNIFYFLYFHYDRWFFLLNATLGTICLLWLNRKSTAPSAPGRMRQRVEDALFAQTASPNLIRWLALAVLILTFGGTYWICLNYPLPMDEFFSNFQADLFIQGHVFSQLSEQWLPFGWAMTPLMTAYDTLHHTWTSGYLPVYSALRAPLRMLGADTLLNPLFTAGSILAIAAAAKRIFPLVVFPAAPVIASLLLATSPQVLIIGMTAYTMPAHLCLNLCWLVLYLRADRVSLGFTPWIGFLAMGLHQPNVHLIFAAPFFVRMLWQRRWGRLAYFSAVYIAAVAIWYGYMLWKASSGYTHTSSANASYTSGVANMFGLPSMPQWIIFGLSGSLVFIWQSSAVGLLALLALLRWRRLPEPLPELAVGGLLGLVFYLCFAYDQGHGWGNRYYFPYLGNLTLLATAGWPVLVRIAGLRPARTLLLASTALALCVQFPLRCWEVRRVTAPFATAMRYLQSLPEPFVAIDTGSIWYGKDLVRNDPLLRNTPKLLFLDRLTRDRLDALRARGNVRLVSFRELAPFGVNYREPDPPSP